MALFGKKKKEAGEQTRREKGRGKSKRVVRVKELEAALAEDKDIDVDAIVSMYMPKRRMARIGEALLRLGTLQKVLICLALFMAVLFGISFMQENMGNFTINLNRLELFRRGVAIADNSQFEGATARLAAEAVSYGTNIAEEDREQAASELAAAKTEAQDAEERLAAAAKAYEDAASQAEQRHARELAQAKQDFEQRLAQLSARLGQSERARARAEKRAEGNKLTNYLRAHLRGDDAPVEPGDASGADGSASGRASSDEADAPSEGGRK